MTCRNVSDDIKTESWVPLSRAVWETSAYCPDGVRHKGGASLAWALMWNVRTCDSERRWLASSYPPDHDGRSSSCGPARGRVPNAEHRGGPPRSSWEAR